jgi:hypothetical protein
MAQTFCHNRHHLNGEKWRLADQKLKAPLIDGDQLALRPGGGVGASYVTINQRHLAEDAAGHYCLGDGRADQDVDFALRHNVHQLALLHR